MATITVVTNLVWVDQSGNKQEKPEFHNCVAWRKLAEIIGQYLSKGRRVYVEGRVQTRDWVGQDGVKRYRTEVVVDNLIMLDGPRGSASSPQDGSGVFAGETVAPPQADESEEIKVEDIPF